MLDGKTDSRGWFPGLGEGRGAGTEVLVPGQSFSFAAWKGFWSWVTQLPECTQVTQHALCT